MTKFYLLISLFLFAFSLTTVNQVEPITEQNNLEVAEVEVAELESFNLQSGYYVVDRENMAPIFSIDKEKQEWMTTASIATSYAIGGRIFATTEGYTPADKNNQVKNFLATTEDGNIEILFKVDEGCEFTILRVKNERKDLKFWIEEGMVFQAEHLNSLYPDFMDVIAKPEDAYAKAKEAGVTVFEDQKLVSGEAGWLSFYESSKRGQTGSVLCAYYYTKEMNGSVENHSEEINKDYPRLYFNEIFFDGKLYRLKSKESALPEVTDDSYKYLLHFEGAFPENSDFSRYEYYVLTDRDDVTWDEIEKSMLSSQSGAAIRHTIVYSVFK